MGMLIGLVECDRFGCGHCLTDGSAGDEMRTLFVYCKRDRIVIVADLARIATGVPLFAGSSVRLNRRE